MGRLLQLIWLVKTFLTGASAWRYCSDTVISPFCVASGFYTLVLVIAIFVPLQKNPSMALLEAQETLRILRLEEGVVESFAPLEENGSICSSLWRGNHKRKHEDIDKEKYS